MSCSQYKTLNNFRGLKVGAPLPETGGYSLKDKSYSSSQLRKDKRYFVGLIDNKYHLDDWCMDEDCGVLGQEIKNTGGHLLILTDAKYTRQFKIDLDMKKKLNPLDGNLLVIADQNQKMIGLYIDAKYSDIRDLLKKHRLL